MEKLKEQIKTLQDEITANIRNINLGGCIQFVYFFSKRLTELNIKHSVSLADKWDDLKLNYNSFANCGLDHVMIYIPKIGYIDGEKTVDLKRLKAKYNYVHTRVVSLSRIKRFASIGGWNPAYNPDQNDLLEELINKIIK